MITSPLIKVCGCCNVDDDLDFPAQFRSEIRVLNPQVFVGDISGHRAQLTGCKRLESIAVRVLQDPEQILVEYLEQKKVKFRFDRLLSSDTTYLIIQKNLPHFAGAARPMQRQLLG